MAPVTVLHVVDRSWVSSLFIFPSVAAAHDKIRELFPHEAARFTDDDALISLLCDEGTSIDIETLEAEWLIDPFYEMD